MLAELEKIQWFVAPEDETILSRHGISYGFCGVDQTPPPCFHLQQIHSDRLVAVTAADSPQEPLPQEGDGLYTRTPGLCLGVKTADCLPIILATSDRSFLAVLHAGWRGLTAGIIAQALRQVEKLSPLSRLLVVTGPCIGLTAFEVGPEVVAAVAKMGLSPEQLGYCLQKGKADRWHVDLSCVAGFFLLNAGCLPGHLAIMRSCTFSQPELWYSYRRSQQARPSIWTWAHL